MPADHPITGPGIAADLNLPDKEVLSLIDPEHHDQLCLAGVEQLGRYGGYPVRSLLVDSHQASAQLFDGAAGVEPAGLEFDAFTQDLIPEDLVADAESNREQMIEAAAEANDELMEKFFDAGELSEEEIRAGLRQRTLSGEIVVCMCGSAFKNKGVQAMLDAVIDFMPSPIDVPAIKGVNDDESEGERPADDDASFSCLLYTSPSPRD